jgi:hypothetical protein
VANGDERDVIRAEVESALRNYGVPQSEELVTLTGDELIRVRAIASRIVHGDVDKDELSNLTESVRGAVAAAVQRLMELRSSSRVQELQTINPYYSVSQPRVIHDNAAEHLPDENNT